MLLPITAIFGTLLTERSLYARDQHDIAVRRGDPPVRLLPFDVLAMLLRSNAGHTVFHQAGSSLIGA